MMAKPRTGREILHKLQKTGFVGMWEDRDDIGNSSEFAAKLRRELSGRLDDVSSSNWIIHEDDIIAYCYPSLMAWVAAGRPPAATYFTAGLLRFIATFVEEQLARQATETRPR